MVPGFGVSAECQSIGTIEHIASPYWQDNGWPLNKDGSCCIGTIGKKQMAVARSRGLVIQLKKLSVGAYFELSFLGCSFLFIFPTGPTALNSEPRRRRYAKNTGHDRNRLYSRASIVLPVWRCIIFNDSYLRARMKLRIVQKIRFSLLGVSAECQSIGTSGKNQRACYLAPKTLS